MNKEWLIENSDIPIKYILTSDPNYLDQYLQNCEVQYWLSQLKPRAENRDLGKIHGSHDYRMENILGKLSILGFSNSIPLCAQYLSFIINFLNNHINEPQNGNLSFGKLYAFRDYETVLACFLPMLGYWDEPAVKHITGKRINILYGFVQQRLYDIYIDGSRYKGIKKEWQPYIINPELYADGNIALPTMHDFILFAGMYNKLDDESKNKIEAIVNWIFDERYMKISRRYGYFYVPGGAYDVKAFIFKMHLINFKNMALSNADVNGLIFTCFILSHFESAKMSEWFQTAMIYLDHYKTTNNRYIFPRNMIMEKPDCYVTGGGHMNIGENRKSKKYAEIISTCWMDKIKKNLL